MTEILLWAGALILLVLLTVVFVIGMADADRQRRRAYLGLCIYCGLERHSGECTKTTAAGG